MKNKYIFYPLFLLLLVFTLDKIALVPSIRDYGRRNATPLENVTLSFYHHLLNNKKRKGRKDYIMLGSSRSEFFKLLHPKDIQQSKYLNVAQKKELSHINIETRGIIRASDLWVIYNQLYVILQSRQHPDYLVIEVSPEMLNKNSPHSLKINLQTQTYSTEPLLDVFSFASGSLQREALKRLLFASYGTGFRPEQAVKNYIKGIDYKEDAKLTLAILSQQKSLTRLPVFVEHYSNDSNKVVKTIYEKKFIQYTKTMKKRSILKNYAFSEAELNVLKAIIKKCKNNNIPLLVWIPPVHDLMNREWEKEEMAKDIRRLISTLVDSKVVFHQFKIEEMQCKFWADSSHLSDLCAPEVFYKIIKMAPSK